MNPQVQVEHPPPHWAVKRQKEPQYDEHSFSTAGMNLYAQYEEPSQSVS